MFPNVDNGRFRVHEDGTLVIDSIQRSDAGEYSCHALSQAGSVETSMRIDVRGTLPPHSSTSAFVRSTLLHVHSLGGSSTRAVAKFFSSLLRSGVISVNIAL